MAAGQPKPRERTPPKQGPLIRCAGPESPPAFHGGPARGFRKQRGNAQLEGALPLRGEALCKTRVPLRCGAHHHQAVFSWHQINARSEDHALEGASGSLEGEHLPFHRENRQLRQELATPGSGAKHGNGTASFRDRSFSVTDACSNAFVVALKQLQHFHALQELHPPLHAGAFQGAHQLAAVVDLAVLLEQQTGLPRRGDARYFPLQLLAVQGGSEACRGVAIPLFAGGEWHHNPCGAKPAGQAAVGLDLGDPARHPLQAQLTESQLVTAQAFSVGSQHACGHESCGFSPPPADHAHRMVSPGQLMGDGQAHQSAAKDQRSVSGRRAQGGHG